MPAEAGPPPAPLPPDFLRQLEGREELLVSSRDGAGRGRVPMWFAVAPPGHVYLLTPAVTLKAERWRRDPWVELRVPGGGPRLEGVVSELGWEEAEPLAGILTERFALAGAATPEALRWMLEDGSRRLLRVGQRPGSDLPGPVQGQDRG